ncbi:hypothetical protein J6590_021178 [Homalodisca vitripennis]|nr:hypothetical protein J6590_021178 [Homalodisca vitripennis]
MRRYRGFRKIGDAEWPHKNWLAFFVIERLRVERVMAFSYFPLPVIYGIRKAGFFTPRPPLARDYLDMWDPVTNYNCHSPADRHGRCGVGDPH